MNFPAVGGIWETPSLIWGKEAGQGEWTESISPLGTSIQQFRLLSSGEIDRLFAPRPRFRKSDLTEPCRRLAEMLCAEREFAATSMRLATGFNVADCHEMLDGAIHLLQHFDPSATPTAKPSSYDGRNIDLVRAPWGTVAVVLPQNAFLIVSLTCLLSALSSGNRVILRAPSIGGRSAGILGHYLLEAGFDPDGFSIVACDARQFVATLLESPQRPFLHFMGSSRRGGALLQQAFDAGCASIVDGDGNVWVYVDEDYDPDEAAEALWRGAIRYSGQTCTSVNGIVAHPSIENRLRARLQELFATTEFGFEKMVGPVFSKEQVGFFEEAARASGGRMARNGQPLGNLMPATLIEDPSWSSGLVTEGAFCPALWVRTGDYEEFVSHWPTNKFPLSAGVMSYSRDAAEVAADLVGVSRVVMNGDPSIEYVMEPWGGYPGSASNPVSPWVDKYTRVVQIDRPS